MTREGALRALTLNNARGCARALRYRGHARVGIDCLVAFEGRQYSVPFAYVGQTVEVRGCHGHVQVLADCRILANHPRHTQSRIVLDPSHFDGAATDRVLPPPPLGRMGQRLQEIAALAPQRRPIDLYAALAEVAR
jgi:hypothetical protein